MATLTHRSRTPSPRRCREAWWSRSQSVLVERVGAFPRSTASPRRRARAVAGDRGSPRALASAGFSTRESASAEDSAREPAGLERRQAHRRVGSDSACSPPQKACREEALSPVPGAEAQGDGNAKLCGCPKRRGIPGRVVPLFLVWAVMGAPACHHRHRFMPPRPSTDAVLAFVRARLTEDANIANAYFHLLDAGVPPRRLRLFMWDNREDRYQEIYDGTEGETDTYLIGLRQADDGEWIVTGESVENHTKRGANRRWALSIGSDGTILSGSKDGLP